MKGGIVEERKGKSSSMGKGGNKRVNSESLNEPRSYNEACKHFIVYGKCNTMTCKFQHKRLRNKEDVMTFIRQNESFIINAFKEQGNSTHLGQDFVDYLFEKEKEENGFLNRIGILIPNIVGSGMAGPQGFLNKGALNPGAPVSNYPAQGNFNSEKSGGFQMAGPGFKGNNFGSTGPFSGDNFGNRNSRGFQPNNGQFNPNNQGGPVPQPGMNLVHQSNPLGPIGYNGIQPAPQRNYSNQSQPTGLQFQPPASNQAQFPNPLNNQQFPSPLNPPFPSPSTNNAQFPPPASFNPYSPIPNSFPPFHQQNQLTLQGQGISYQIQPAQQPGPAPNGFYGQHPNGFGQIPNIVPNPYGSNQNLNGNSNPFPFQHQQQPNPNPQFNPQSNFPTNFYNQHQAPSNPQPLSMGSAFQSGNIPPLAWRRNEPTQNNFPINNNWQGPPIQGPNTSNLNPQMIHQVPNQFMRTELKQPPNLSVSITENREKDVHKSPEMAPTPMDPRTFQSNVHSNPGKVSPNQHQVNPSSNFHFPNHPAPMANNLRGPSPNGKRPFSRGKSPSVPVPSGKNHPPSGPSNKLQNSSGQVVPPSHYSKSQSKPLPPQNQADRSPKQGTSLDHLEFKSQNSKENSKRQETKRENQPTETPKKEIKSLIQKNQVVFCEDCAFRTWGGPPFWDSKEVRPLTMTADERQKKQKEIQEKFKALFERSKKAEMSFK